MSRRPQKWLKTIKMTFFSPIFQITIVQNLSLCQQSQVFITLLKRVQKGTPGGQPLNKKIPDQKIPDQMSRLAVIFRFFGILAASQKIQLQSREHRGPNLIFMSLKHPPPLPASRFSITPLNSKSNWPKNAKFSKNPL